MQKPTPVWVPRFCYEDSHAGSFSPDHVTFRRMLLMSLRRVFQNLYEISNVVHSEMELVG